MDYALYEYYSAIGAGLKPVGIAALTKDGKIVSAGPLKYQNGFTESATSSLHIKLSALFAKKGAWLPPLDEILTALLTIEGDPDNASKYTVHFHQESEPK